MLNFSMPLGRSNRAPRGHLSYSDNSTGRNSLSASVSGTSGEEGLLSYNISGSNTNQGVGSSGSASAQYINRITTLHGGYSTGNHYNSLSAGLNGSIIGHSAGLTFTPYQGDTFALVEARGLEGAKVNNYVGVRVDGNGYAAIPYLMPYQFNDVAIDPKDTDAGVELESTSRRIVPRDEAIVKVTYNARKGTAILITVNQTTPPLPFGAEVKNSKGQIVGYVGQGGRMFVHVEQDTDTLSVQLTGDNPQRCSVSYRLPSQSEKGKTMRHITSFCNWSS